MLTTQATTGPIPYPPRPPKVPACLRCRQNKRRCFYSSSTTTAGSTVGARCIECQASNETCTPSPPRPARRKSTKDRLTSTALVHQKSRKAVLGFSTIQSRIDRPHLANSLTNDLISFQTNFMVGGMYLADIQIALFQAGKLNDLDLELRLWTRFMMCKGAGLSNHSAITGEGAPNVFEEPPPHLIKKFITFGKNRQTAVEDLLRRALRDADNLPPPYRTPTMQVFNLLSRSADMSIEFAAQGRRLYSFVLDGFRKSHAGRVWDPKIPEQDGAYGIALVRRDAEVAIMTGEPLLILDYEIGTIFPHSVFDASAFLFDMSNYERSNDPLVDSALLERFVRSLDSQLFSINSGMVYLYRAFHQHLVGLAEPSWEFLQWFWSALEECTNNIFTSCKSLFALVPTDSTWDSQPWELRVCRTRTHYPAMQLVVLEARLQLLISAHSVPVWVAEENRRRHPFLMRRILDLILDLKYMFQNPHASNEMVDSIFGPLSSAMPGWPLELLRALPIRPETLMLHKKPTMTLSELTIVVELLYESGLVNPKAEEAITNLEEGMASLGLHPSVLTANSSSPESDSASSFAELLVEMTLQSLHDSGMP